MGTFFIWILRVAVIVFFIAFNAGMFILLRDSDRIVKRKSEAQRKYFSEKKSRDNKD